MCECLGRGQGAPHLSRSLSMLSPFHACRHHTHLLHPWDSLESFPGAVMGADGAHTPTAPGGFCCRCPPVLPPAPIHCFCMADLISLQPDNSRFSWEGLVLRAPASRGSAPLPEPSEPAVRLVNDPFSSFFPLRSVVWFRCAGWACVSPPRSHTSSVP